MLNPVGKQVGREVEVINSFELEYANVNNQIIIDMEYYMTKEGQFKQVIIT